MRQFGRSRSRSRFPSPLVVAGLVTLAVVLPAAVGGAGSAVAAPAAGYTASRIPVEADLVAVDSATDTVYATEITATNAYDVVAIDGSTDAVVATLALTGYPDSIAVDSATDTVYVGYVVLYTTNCDVAVIDGATDTVSATIPLAAVPAAIAVDSITNTVYVANESVSDGGVVVIDGSTDTVTTTFSSGGESPNDVAVDETTDVIWVTNISSGTVVGINAATGSVIDSVSVGQAFDVAVNPVTDYVYATTGGTTLGADSLVVISGASGAITTTVPVTDAGDGNVAVDPSDDVVIAQGMATYDGTFSSGTVIINGATNTVADVLSAGYFGSSDAAVDPSTGVVYESSSDSAFPDMWVITPSASNGISPLMYGPATATAAVGVSFTAASSFAASGLPAPTVSETGLLPSGVTLSADGVLSGTPAAGTAGVYSITVTASNGIAPDFSLPFTLTVSPAVAPAITSADQVVFGTGVAGSFSVAATGSPAPAFSESGALPAGVSFSSAGVLSGTPAAGTGGRYPVTITASNAGGTATQAFTLIVDVPGAPAAAGGVLGDVTGNGLDDILAVDPSGNLWLYPNTGSGNASIFADGRSKVGSGWTGYTLAAVTPLYGATDAGILAIAPGGNLWYYPNTGGTGTGTFGGRSLVGTGWTGYTVVGVTDLYGTGQPGILAIDPAGNLWYYPGTGGTGTGTFGARTQVGSGWTQYTADSTGTSILAVDPSGTMWLYAATGGTGTSTFGTPTQVSTGWAGYQAIDLGTLTTSSNGEDLLGIDPAGNLWYYPSTGSGSYSTPIQVGTGWTGYRIN